MPKIKTTKSKKGVEVLKPGGQWYAEVPIDSIQPHPDNPNTGDVEMIRESIRANEFYGTCTVQASSGRILVGEHRWRAAKLEGLDTIPVTYRDCDDHTAIRIMLVDNETGRAGSVDPDAADTLLRTLGTVEGTGFDTAWLEQQEQERQAMADAEEARIVAGKAAEVDLDIDTVWGIIVMFHSEREQEAGFDALAKKYGAENLRVVSV